MNGMNQEGYFLMVGVVNAKTRWPEFENIIAS